MIVKIAKQTERSVGFPPSGNDTQSTLIISALLGQTNGQDIVPVNNRTA